MYKPGNPPQGYSCAHDMGM